MTRSGSERVEAAVWRVTVLEDRAQVERRAEVELTAGSHVLHVGGVTPLLVDRTLRGRLSGPGAQLRDVRVRREATVRATRPQLQRELAEEIESLRRERRRAYDAVRAVEAEQAAVQGAAADLMKVAAEEAGRGVERSEGWRRALEQMTERQTVLEQQLAQGEVEIEGLDQRLQQLQQRHLCALQPTSIYRAELEAVVEVSEAGRYELVWEYLVPCALWRPAHEALLEGGGRLHWTIHGTIWQRTGEAWKEVELALSTARPAVGAELPLIREDRLRMRAKSPDERAHVDVSSRDEAIASVSRGLDPDRVDDLPGVDDGGETRVFRLPGPVSIPSDGSAHLVQIGRFETDCELDHLCCPERMPLVVLRSQQRNDWDGPLLAGPVRLIRGGGFVGRSRIDFVGPGERFALGWGSEDDLQAVRVISQQEEDAGLIRRARHTVTARIYLSNNGEQARTVQLRERVPVSEVEEVRVEILQKRSTAGFRREQDGHLSWEIPLAAGEHKDLTLVYQVEAARNVRWS